MAFSDREGWAMHGHRLAARQRRRLQRQLAETRDVRVFRRTLAVLELDRGRTAAQVAEALGVSRQSVHNWAAAFARQADPAALADGPRPGRPPLLDDEGRDLLGLLLALSPRLLG